MMEEISINKLFEMLKIANRKISLGIKSELSSEIHKSLEEAAEISETILAKHRLVRENWFTVKSSVYCWLLDKEKYEFAAYVMDDLRYFSHSFLEDSELSKKLSNDFLRLISLYK